MKKNILLLTGGTGGHVIPAVNLANYFISHNINCTIMLDNRGYRFINIYNGKIKIIKSSNLSGNIFKKFFGIIDLLIGFIQSFFIIILLRPNVIISFGSYASFFPMISCILNKSHCKMDIYIHEQNSVLGRTNSLFLGFSKKIFLNFDISSKK